MGSIVKDYLPEMLFMNGTFSNQLSPDEIYHLSVMPCFDKKLEASRSDFQDSVTHARDVDCVIR